MARSDLPLEQLRTHRSTSVEPEGFDAFWQSTLEETRALPLAVRFAPIATALRTVEVYDVVYAGFGGHPVRGWFVVPAGSAEPLPLVVEFLGYGGGRGLPHSHLMWASAGFAHFVMDTRGQGSAWGGGGDTPDPVGSAPAYPGVSPAAWRTRTPSTTAASSPTPCARWRRPAPTRSPTPRGPRWSGRARAAASPSRSPGSYRTWRRPRPRRAVPLRLPPGPSPSASAHPTARSAPIWPPTAAAPNGFAAPWPTQTASTSPPAPPPPALFSVGLEDSTCPPSTVFAAYNAYAGQDKRIEVYEFNGHEGGGPHHEALRLAWVGQRLNE